MSRQMIRAGLVAVVCGIWVVCFQGVAEAESATLGAALSSQQPVASPSAEPPRVIGWISSVSSSDGVISGWAADTQNPQKALTISFYADAPKAQGGTLMGTAVAGAASFPAMYMRGIPGSHGFIFPIPAAFKNNQTRKFYAVASDGQSSVSQALSGSVNSFNLRSIAPTTTVTDSSSCLSPQSACASLAFDYGVPNFQSATAWGDGHDYFKDWGCTSSVGLNRIVRLNIIPYGNLNGTKYHDINFQKDSLLVNLVDQMFGSPIVYFTSSRYNTYSSVYSLKKAAYRANGNWQIFDMLDYPSNSGGFSSLDGRYPSFIMNDYSQPGWGPTSPNPGSRNYVPGVANTSVNPENNSFPLIGTGLYGLTTIANLMQGPGVRDGGVGGRTCLQMNPKLFDYNSSGVPQSMTAYLFQQATTGEPLPCLLPDGSALPSVGYYVYHYQGAAGWQLDKNFGPVESDPNPDQAMKLESGANNHTFIAGNWSGEITTINLDNPPPRTKAVILSCHASVRGSTAKFGEATGNASQIWFLAIPPGAPLTYGNGVFTGDIYYAYSTSAGVDHSLR